MANWTFRTPTIEEGPASWEDMLFLRVKLTRGISVTYQGGGAYTAIRYPTQDEITASLANGQFYMGGSESTVDDATRTALIAAGIGVTAANFTLIP